jgi:hypothetical protein
LIGGDVCFPRRCRGAAGGGYGSGELLRRQSVEEKSRWQHERVHKREGKKGRPERGREGGRDSPDFEVFARSDGGLRRAISRRRWRLRF